MNFERCKYLLLWISSAFIFHNTELAAQRQFLPSYIDNYSEDDGLYQNGGMGLLRDHRGFLWIGTWYDLYRFDGVDFEQFHFDPLQQNSIKIGAVDVLIEDRNHAIWMGGRLFGGVSRYDPESGIAETFVHERENTRSIASNMVGSILEDSEGKIWIGTNNYYLHEYHPDSKDFTRHKLPIESLVGQANEWTSLGNIIEDRFDQNLLWIACRFGLFKFNKKTLEFTLYQLENIKWFLYVAHRLPLHMDAEGRIWMGYIRGDGLFVFDPKEEAWIRQIQSPDAGDRVLSNAVNSILPLNDTLILATSFYDGLWLIDRRNFSMQIIENNLVNSQLKHITQCLLDDDGNLWISHTGGLMRLQEMPSPFEYVRMKDLADQVEHANWNVDYLFTPGQDTLFIGTRMSSGVLRYLPDQNTLDVINDFDENGQLVRRGSDDLAYDANGNIWVASWDKVGKMRSHSDRVDIVTFNEKDQKFFDDEITYRLFPDAEHLYISIYGKGVVRMQFESDTLVPFFSNSVQTANYTLLEDEIVYALAEDHQERLWLGTEHGLYCYDKRHDRMIAPFESDPLIESMHQFSFGDFIVTDTALWAVSVGAGLWRFDFLQDQVKAHVFSHPQNVAANQMYKMQASPEGRIWILSVTGLCIFDQQSGDFQTYTKDDGLAGANLETSLIGDTEGTWYIGYSEGFKKTTETALRQVSGPIQPYLKRLRINGKRTRSLLTSQPLILKRAENDLEFDLGAINFGIRDRNFYRYRLDGYDEQWINGGSNTLVRYTNLPGGSYAFNFQVANRHGIWASADEPLAISIKKALHEIWYVRLGAFLLLVLLLWFLRNKYLKARYRKEAEQALEYLASPDYKGKSVDDILWDVIHNVIRHLGFEDCVIYLLDDENALLVQKAALGPKNPKFRQILDPIKIPMGKGITGAAAATGRVILVHDTAQDARYITDLQTHSSELAVPIIYQEEVLGVIDSEHPRRNFFSPDHVRTLKQVASICATHLAHKRAEERAAQKEHELLSLQKEMAETKLAALRAQMNPHFIFNTLNSINLFIAKNNGRKASGYLSKFAKLIRNILDNSELKQISLARELETLELYIEMESIRFDQRFDFSIQVDEEINENKVMVAPMLLQPYVENAIWHGLMNKPEKGRLDILITMSDGHLKCIIQDDGIGRAAARKLNEQSILKKTSRGMRLTSDRIRLINEQHHEMVRIIDLVHADGTAAGTRVEVLLPYEV